MYYNSMVDDTFKDDSIILDILERNLGKNNAKKVLKTLSGNYDADSIILSLKKTLKGKIPETRLERLLKDFSDANTILPDTEKEAPSETEIPSERKYDVKKELGRGGMGAVYRVEESSLERDVAMKKIIGSPTDHGVKRFIREAKITAKLDHPNIVTIHDFGLNKEGEYYFTMNHVKGNDLKEILNKIDNKDPKYLKKYTLNKKLQIYKGILDAIALAHSKGIIHRDLKPANIMVGRFGEVQVMDWGLAKDNSKEDIVSDGKVKETRKGLTLDGQVMGSPGFMAPEQADGRIEDVDELSDVWSLGAILYKMLSLEKPIDGDSVREIVINTARGKVIPLRKKAKKVSKELESIVMKAIAPEREDRYPNVEKLHEDIDSYLERKPVSAHSYGITEKINKWIQRHPTAAISCGVAAILLSISGVVGGLLYSQKEEAKDKAKTETARADDATLEKKAAQSEVRGQQQSEAILSRIKFLKVNENYYESALPIIQEAIDSSKNYWKPYLVLAKHQARFGNHQEAEKLFEKANEVFRKQLNKDSVEIFFEAGMYYGLPLELGGRGLEETAHNYFKKAYSANPNAIFGKLSRATELMIKAKINPDEANKYLSEAVKISKELTKDITAKNIDATWLVRGWVLGTSIFSDYKNPSFLKHKNLSEAKNALLHVVDESHGKINIRNFLAMLYAHLGEHDKAIQILSKLLKIKKEDFLYLNRGFTYAKKGDPEKAIQDYNKAIRLNPKEFIFYYNRGSAYHDKGDLEKAIVNYDEAIRLNPKFVGAYLDRGLAYKKKGKLKKAIEDFNEAIMLNPKLTDAYFNRGHAYEDKGDLEKAIEDYNEAIRLNPKKPNIYNNRGTAYAGKGNLEKAIEDFNEAIRLNPKFAVAYSNRGLAYKNKGNLEKAIEDLNEAIRLDPKFVDAYIIRGTAYADKGDLEKAIEDFTKSINLDPKFITAYSNRAMIYGHMRKFDKSIEDCTKIIEELDPKYAGAYFIRGVTYAFKGDFVKAIKDLDEAIKLKPDDGHAYSNRADCHIGLGQFAEAEADIKKSLSLGFNAAYITLGELHMKKGDYNKAILAFKEAYQKAPQYKSMIDENMEKLKQKMKEK